MCVREWEGGGVCVVCEREGGGVCCVSGRGR